MHIDRAALLSVDHACTGCREGEVCCCATYEVCVTAEELDRIIAVLPEAAKRCPHLNTDEGYDNVFDEVESGLFAIDTTEDGLCLLAYLSDGTIQCSLHTVAVTQGLPLDQVKPRSCILWPMSVSDSNEVLSLTDDALSFSCTSRKRKGSHSRLSPAFIDALTLVYGKSILSCVKG